MMKMGGTLICIWCASLLPPLPPRLIAAALATPPHCCRRCHPAVATPPLVRNSRCSGAAGDVPVTVTAGICAACTWLLPASSHFSSFGFLPQDPNCFLLPPCSAPACLQVGGPTALETLEAAAAAAEADEAAAGAAAEANSEPQNLLKRFGSWLKRGF